jgi:branched-chain amino acid transport system permease protein
MHLLLQQIVNGIQLGSIYALIALGYTMVYGILRLINFAHGDVYMVGAYVSFWVVDLVFARTGGDPSWWLAFFALIASMLCCGVLGVLIERLAYKPLRNAPRLAPLITAIGVSLFLENFFDLPFRGPSWLRYPFGPNPQYCPATIPNDSLTYHLAGITIARNSLIIFAATLFLLALLWYIVTRTRIGKAMRAVSFDKDAASLMGININNTISFTFFLGSALAGAAGFLIADLAHIEMTPYMGILPGVKAFVAAVLGGIGNIPGAALGGLIMGLAEALVQGYAPAMHIPPSYSDGVAFLILIVILLFRPAGLLGKGAVEKV